MPITRVVCDLVTEEPLTRHQLQTLASDLNNSLQAVVSDEIEGRQQEETTFHHAHLHVSSARRACDTCVQLAQDEMS